MDDYSIAPPPFKSWTQLNPDTKQWLPPVPYPSDGKIYVWAEDVQSWVLPIGPVDIS